MSPIKHANALATAIGIALATVGACRAARADAPERRVLALTGDGVWLIPSQDHAALSRELPTAVGAGEPEAVRLIFIGPSQPTRVRLSTRRSNGSPLDTLLDPALGATACPPPAAGADRCWSTLPLRLTPDRLDRDYSVAHHRSLEAELGGELQVQSGAELLGSWRVGAPHSPAFVGLDRLSLKLRVRVLRVAASGPPALGVDSASALLVARNEVQAANKLWAQCGVDLVGPGGLDLQLVDPPPTELVAIGCDAGLPASGGQVTLSVLGQRVRVPTRAGEPPTVVAARLARALRALGLSVRLSDNPRISSGAGNTLDLLVRGLGGRPVNLGSDFDPRVPLSSDRTLGVCLGEVDLGDGLTHFVENDAAAGTLEERALVKAFDDGDPSTIEVFMIPSFDPSGRIGESFIDDGPGIQNTVIVDRAALRAGPRSNALAHELGHILLNLPGHPDDYGIDQSESLMDSDASDASVFGPRRLSLEDCERALRESGPNAHIPLLKAWSLPPASIDAEPSTSGR